MVEKTIIEQALTEARKRSTLPEIIKACDFTPHAAELEKKLPDLTARQAASLLLRPDALNCYDYDLVMALGIRALSQSN